MWSEQTWMMTIYTVRINTESFIFNLKLLLTSTHGLVILTQRNTALDAPSTFFLQMSIALVVGSNLGPDILERI